LKDLKKRWKKGVFGGFEGSMRMMMRTQEVKNDEEMKENE